MASVDYLKLYHVAQRYYQEGLTQAQISERENISRSQVSRMLDAARELGIVRIEVTLPEEMDRDSLGAFLQERLGLKRVILAEVDPDMRDERSISLAVAQEAAKVLPRLLRGCRVVGLGWGKTMYRMASCLSFRQNRRDTVFVPLIGASGNDNPFLQINTIIDRVAEHLNGDLYFTNLPAFREKEVPLTAYESKRLQLLHEYWDHLDAAVFGMGSRTGSDEFFDEEIPAASRERIRKEPVIGDLLSQFFCADGSLLAPDEGYHTNAFPAGRLKNINNAICLAGGSEKTDALLTAAQAGYFKILITDTNTAGQMYDRIRNEVTL